MFDAYLWLTPLLVLPILLLFVFVGCATIWGLDEVHLKEVPLRILVEFQPARTENLIPVVDIQQNGETFPTFSEGTTSLPNGDSQFKLYNPAFDAYSHPGSCTITCRVYLNEIFGSPVIGPISCEFDFSFESTTAVFAIDHSNNIIGCLTAS